MPEVTFIVPGLRATGGIRAVFEIADRLGARGRSVEILVPERSLLAPRKSVAGILQRYGPRGAWVQRLAPSRPMQQDWFPLRTPLRVAGTDLVQDLPADGVVVTTSYRTAEAILGWPHLRSRGIAFAQGYEIWDGPRSRVDATWRAFDRTIVTSPHLEQIARDLGRHEVVLAPYGVDLELFTRAGRRPNEVPVVGFHHDDRAFKGSPAVIAALAALREDGVAFEARCFGLGTASVPDWVGQRGPLAGEDLASFYRGTDVFVMASTEESGPMTVPEAMASGCAVVATRVGCIDLWSDAGAAICVLRDPTGVAAAVRGLLEDPEGREALATRGTDVIQGFGWDRMVDTFEAALVGWGSLPA